MNRRRFLSMLGLGAAAAVVAPHAHAEPPVLPVQPQTPATGGVVANDAMRGISEYERDGLACGGIVDRSGLYLVGEKGPEVVVPITTVHYINLPKCGDGASIVEAIRRYERANGPGWRA